MGIDVPKQRCTVNEADIFIAVCKCFLIAFINNRFACFTFRFTSDHVGTGDHDIRNIRLCCPYGFIEGEVGLDFGAGVKSPVGFKAAATYNIIWARPAWTDRGTWALYAGPGLALGGVADRVTYKINDIRHSIMDNGFMMSLVAQAGVEYTFWFPLQLSIDMRPYFGFHTNKGYEIVGGPASIQYGAKTSFYDRGLLGFIPTLSVRYRF